MSNQQPPTFPNFTDGHRRHPDVIQALHELPDLCAETLATVGTGAPNPGARTGHTRRPRPDSKPPINLDLIDALAPGRGVRWELAQAARAVHEDHPHLALDHEPSIAANCAWLITHAHAWQPDPFLCEFVTDSVNAAYRLLQDLVRTIPEKRWKCSRPGCGARAHLQPGGRYLICESGHTLDINAERGTFLRMQDWTLTETHRALRDHAGLAIPLETLKTWKQRKKIEPISDTPPLRFNFGAVLRAAQRHSLGKHAAVC